jgi:hypothetical protein
VLGTDGSYASRLDAYEPGFRAEGIRKVVAALATTESGRLADEVRSRLLAHGFGDVDVSSIS